MSSPISKITYPRCPYCDIEINLIEIFDLRDLFSPYGRRKVCPNNKCGKVFDMETRLELSATAFKGTYSHENSRQRRGKKK